ncbi:MAG: flagellar basal-body rod protein FlgF [Deltaproteobacteria bacterium]|nr:flagellar basal-body rod protein FlgF [Deltaproteobacteria bacterium]
MNGAIHLVAAGGIFYEKKLDVLANNLSNINTVGFKKDQAFRLSALKENPEQTSISGKSQNLFSILPFGTRTDFSPGSLQHTENALDLALNGNGFFCIKTPEAIQYTRKGNFTLNENGVLVTQEGLPVLGEGGEIKIDGKNIVVDAQGNVSVDGTTVDTIKIVDFPQTYVLEKAGNSLFTLTDSSIAENKAEGVEVQQGFVEFSNVDAIRMMTEMIEVLRGYESYQKVIQNIDDVNSKAINGIGRLA